MLVHDHNQFVAVVLSMMKVLYNPLFANDYQPLPIGHDTIRLTHLTLRAPTVPGSNNS